MPLDDFINEIGMAIITSQDDVAESIVERVKPLRFAEQNVAPKSTAHSLSTQRSHDGPALAPKRLLARRRHA